MKALMLASSAVLIAAAFTSAVMTSSDAFATKSQKVTICHATNSQSNPYVKETVNTSSIDELNNAYLNGHGDHTGPVWHQGIADHSWGDIIPAFTSPIGHSYPGMNMTTEGKTILNDGCSVKIKTPTGPSTPVTPPKSDDHGKGSNQGSGTGGGKSSVTPATPGRTVSAIVVSGVTDELPHTGDSSLALISTLGAGSTTYGLARLIRKLLGK